MKRDSLQFILTSVCDFRTALEILQCRCSPVLVVCIVVYCQILPTWSILHHRKTFLIVLFTKNADSSIKRCSPIAQICDLMLIYHVINIIHSLHFFIILLSVIRACVNMSIWTPQNWLLIFLFSVTRPSFRIYFVFYFSCFPTQSFYLVPGHNLQ